jgi:chorismate mutase
MDLGFDGLLVESHCDPDKAWSDASQQVTPEVLDFIVSRLIFRDTSEHPDTLKDLRKEIDEIDNDLIDLLAKRMRICRNIGEYKKENGMTIVQTRRYSEILDKRGAQGSLLGIDTVCIKNIFEHIHEESVRQQMEIINK